MKTKIFAYEVRKNLWVLATARIVNKKCYVNYCYADSTEEVKPEHLPIIKIDITLWCDQNNAVLWSY